jgi:putative transposase
MDSPTPHTNRKRLVRTAAFGEVRFLTFSCQQRLPLLSNPNIASLFAKRLSRARETWQMKLLAWVIMPEHVHLMLIPPRLEPGEPDATHHILEFIKKSVAQRVIHRWKAIDASNLADISAGGSPRFWQKGGGFDRCVRDAEEMTRELRYIHHNPVKRGLCAQPTDWEFSSARWWARHTGDVGPDPLVECDTPPGEGWDQWQGWR